MIPDLVRDFAKQLAIEFASRAYRYRMSAADVIWLEVWAMRRLAKNDYELLRTTKLSAVWMLVDRLLNEYLASSSVSYIATNIEIESGLRVRVKCLDVEVGSATFDRAVGLAHTTFEPSDDYSMVAPYARDVGRWLAVRHYWRPTDGDATDIIAEQWRGERLCLENHLGHELAVSHVIITETTPRAPNSKARILLVADFRPDHARVAAVVPTGDIGSRGRSK